jgi:hypothetical protein
MSVQGNEKGPFSGLCQLRPAADMPSHEAQYLPSLSGGTSAGAPKAAHSLLLPETSAGLLFHVHC